MILICPQISNFSKLLSKSLGMVPNLPITIGTTITHIIHSFLCSFAKSKYESIF